MARSKRVEGQAVAVAIHLGDDAVIVGGLDDDGDVLVVLGSGADHGRAADVDVLDGVFQDRLWRRWRRKDRG